METNRGKLLISTKAAAAGRKAYVIFCTALFWVFGIIMLANFDVFPHMARDLFGRSSLGGILGIVVVAFFFAFPCFLLAVTFLGSRSYCDVYENGVAGMTGMSVNNPRAPMQSFDIGYPEILNVSESGKTLYIYTQYTTYEILALKNRTQAAQEIRARIKIQK